MTRRRTLLAALAAVATVPAAGAPACPPLLGHSLPRLQDEQPVNLCGFAGRVLLVVNTASRCGYTPQYKGLAALHRRYGGRGLTILGFPANDFGGQEPAANAEVARFCENQFDVQFPMFAKSVVVPGPRRNPLYAALAERTGVSPGWNFHKYLISRDGQQVTSFPSAVEPEDPGLMKAIERLLLSNQH
jgi:glutathione peroxidase